MKALLSDLWSLVLPAALSLCAILTLLSLLAKMLLRTREGANATSTSTFSLSFALPLAPVVLLLALWLSPQTAATTATLLVRQSPEALRFVFLFAPLALFFLWCEGNNIAETNARRGRAASEMTLLDMIFARVFGEPPPGSVVYKVARFFVMLFALCCLFSLLFDLVPTLAHLFWRQAARIGSQVSFSLPIAPNTFVSTLGVVLLLVLALPQFFPHPGKVIAWMLLLLLPCVLLFYGALCLVAAREASAASQVVSLPQATGSALHADTLLATLGIFRPAFGWLALLCCLPYSVPRRVATSQEARKTITLLSLFLAFACLLGFIGITAAPIVASKVWLLGEQGLNPLRSAFLSGYPNEGWLIEAALAALGATTLLALSALTHAALSVLHEKAVPWTLALLMFATMFGMLSSGSKGGGERWQTGLLFVLQHTQEIGQLAQGVASLLFLAALCVLALRSLALSSRSVLRR